MFKLKKIHLLLSAIVFLLLSNISFSQVKNIESTEEALESENYSHDIIIGLLISVIVILQVIVFLKTQKRITFFRNAIDTKDKYKTVKIKIPVRWAENWDIERIMDKKDSLKGPNTNLHGHNHNVQSVSYIEGEIITNVEGSNDIVDQKELSFIENEALDLFSAFEDEEQDEMDNSWVTIQKFQDGRIQTKRIMRKNFDRYNKLGWKLFD
jgi:hypothetical protein